MDRLSQELALACSSDKLGEKWLISPSMRIGRQWLDSAAFLGACPINVHTKTIRRTAFDIAMPILTINRIYMDDDAGVLVVRKLLQDLNLPYFQSVSAKISVAETVYSTIQLMKSGHITPHDLNNTTFPNPTKSAALQEVFSEYLKFLEQHDLFDGLDILKTARDLVVNTRCLNGVKILIPDDMKFRLAEKALVESFPKDNLIILRTGSEKENSQENRADKDLIRHVKDISSAPEAAQDGSIEVFRSIGEVNEVREVLRRCCKDQIPFDQIELIHTDYETYVPLIFETIAGYQTEGSVTLDSLAATFAEGIPATYTRPVRSLLGFLDWIHDRFSQDILVRLIEEHLVRISEDEKIDNQYTALAETLRNMDIGIGLDRYVPTVQTKIEELESLINNGAGSQRRLDLNKTLGIFLQKLGSVCPSKFDLVSLTQSCSAFIEGFTASESELDHHAMGKLRQLFKKQLDWLSKFPDCNLSEGFKYLIENIKGIRIAGSGPLPGKIHVSSIGNGGHSGRSNIFIMGMDESRFPGGTHKLPLLSDAAGNLADLVEPETEQINGKVADFANLADRAGGKLTLSYPCYDINEDRDLFPSNVLFTVCRILFNNRDADQTAIENLIGTPVSFAPESIEKCTTAAEWWMYQSCEPWVIGNRENLIAEFFPHLEAGKLAQLIRSGADFTNFDGKIGKVDPKYDPFDQRGPSMNFGMLETVGKCPRCYFFRFVLGLKPPKDTTVDLTIWLEPNAMGNLLHEVFYHFMKDFDFSKDKPTFDKHIGQITKILDRHVEKYKQIFPPPTESALRRQCILLKRAVEIFLYEEEELCKKSSPVEFEGEIRNQSINLKTRAIRGTARFDRIDYHEDDGYWIWDYKSGKSESYQKKDIFDRGRRIQHAYYMLLADASFKRPHHFGFFFTSGREKGLRILHTRDCLIEAANIIENLCTIISEGLFVPTTSTGDCEYCPYVPICGDIGLITKYANDKIIKNRDSDLKLFAELRAEDVQKIIDKQGSSGETIDPSSVS